MSLMKNVIKMAPLVPKTAAPSRAISNFATPAREKVSNAEMAIMGTGLVASWFAVPAWVLVHLNEYNKDK